MRISAISGKGGAGKTTGAILIAGELALQGRKVLLIDCDGRQNLMEWWKRSDLKGNLPAGISVRTAAKEETLTSTIDREANLFDVVIMDAPGVDTVLSDRLIRLSDLVITPVQPAQAEIRAAGEAAELVADVGDAMNREIPHLLYRTRITVVNRNLEEYRFIRPFVQNLNKAGYNGLRLMDSELLERNCYREIMTGLGTLQMLDLSDPVKKGRLEVQQFVHEISQAALAEA